MATPAAAAGRMALGTIPHRNGTAPAPGIRRVDAAPPTVATLAATVRPPLV